MYMEIVNTLLEGAIAEYSKLQNIAQSKVLKKIREHIDKTQKEHRRDEPEISYEEPFVVSGIFIGMARQTRLCSRGYCVHQCHSKENCEQRREVPFTSVRWEAGPEPNFWDLRSIFS
jgi:hypothetical protein